MWNKSFLSCWVPGWNSKNYWNFNLYDLVFHVIMKVNFQDRRLDMLYLIVLYLDLKYLNISTLGGHTALSRSLWHLLAVQWPHSHLILLSTQTHILLDKYT